MEEFFPRSVFTLSIRSRGKIDVSGIMDIAAQILHLAISDLNQMSRDEIVGKISGDAD